MPLSEIDSHDDAHVAVRLSGATELATTRDVTGDSAGVPAVTVNEFGRGRVVYLPGRLDAIQCDELNPLIERLFANAVRWVARGHVPVQVSAEVPVAVTSFDQTDRRVVHLVSLNGDSRYASHHVHSAGRVTVSLEIPPQRAIRRIRALWAKAEVVPQHTDGGVSVVLEDMDEYEVLAIEWE